MYCPSVSATPGITAWQVVPLVQLLRIVLPTGPMPRYKNIACSPPVAMVGIVIANSSCNPDPNADLSSTCWPFDPHVLCISPPAPMTQRLLVWWRFDFANIPNGAFSEVRIWRFIIKISLIEQSLGVTRQAFDRAVLHG